MVGLEEFQLRGCRYRSSNAGKMRSPIVALLLLISFIASCSACCATLTKPLTGIELAKIENNNTVALVHLSKKDNKIHVFCTGVFVSSDTIITANHCVEGLADIINDENSPSNTINIFSNIYSPDFLLPTVVNPLGLTVPFSLANEITNPGQDPAATHLSTSVALYPKYDIAILRITNPKSVHHGVARLADKTPEQGATVSVMGHTKGLYFTYMSGTVAGYRDDLSGLGLDDVEGPFLQIEAPVYHGNSGGGAFDQDGHLIGIADFIMETPDMGFFICLDNIRAILIGQGVINGVIDTTAPDPDLSLGDHSMPGGS